MTDATGHPRSGGFSLIEVVVALGVLALGIASVIALFAAATAAHKRAINRVDATAIAEQVFADVESALARGASPPELAANPPLEAVRRDFPGYDVEVAFQLPVGRTDQVVLRVTVHWVQRGRPHQEVFHQVITRAARIE